MSDFLTEKLATKEEGFCTSQLQAALTFLLQKHWKQCFDIEYKLKTKLC
jgi:hypothetical protein